MRSLTPMPINQEYRNGRRVMLSCVIMFALVHVCGYLPTAEPRNLPANWMSITSFVPVWVWVIAWGAVVIVALWELFTGKGRRAISLTVCLMVGSAAAFLGSYIVSVVSNGWGSREWFYFGWYIFGAGIVYGLLKKVGALKLETENEADDSE